jgi:BCD family chlorophyll transporter-like MFS transporter
MPLPLLIRLGLRQFAAGMLSVLALGILNRVMKVEMGLPLGLVSVVIGIHYFAAPLAIPLGHRSDVQPLRGMHRTPYILAGAALTVLTTIAAPFLALFMQSTQASPLSVSLGILNFLLLGVGIYTAGTAYLSLIADRAPEQERGKAVAVVWSMMMLGILVGVFFGVGILDAYDPERLVLLFLLMAAIVAVFTGVAIWRVEKPRPDSIATKHPANMPAWMLLAHGRQTRLFFLFLFCGILFLFLQQVVLEPFGGDVFAMSVRETTLFNAFQMVGVLLGMGFAGGYLSKRMGNKPTAGLGLALASLAFLALSAAAFLQQPGLVNPAIFLMGLGMGLFNVGGLAMMMGMSVEGLTGTFMGAWTLSQALANGLASIGGGLLHDLGLRAFGAEAGAYGLVFVIEAAGLLLTLALLRSLSVAHFRSEADSMMLLLGEAG